METYTTEKERKIIDTWNTKPNYQKDIVRKSDAEIAKEWMLKEVGFYFEKWLIAPDDAQKILTEMGLNRRVKLGGLLKYSSSIKKGRWVLSPQGLIFDENGRLLDGQHRLKAVIESGVPTPFVVFLNVPHDTPIDNGIPRSAADSLRIRGELDESLSTKDNMSMVNALFAATLTDKECKAITHDDLSAFISKYPSNVNSARIASYRGGQDLYCKRASVRGAFLAASICGIKDEILDEFAEIVNTGCYQKENQKAALVLRRMLNEIKTTGGTNSKILESATELALEDFIKGFPRKRVYKDDSQHPYSSKINVREVIA